ncbi:hypothetical protein HK105_203642 [Polyrhizophydium stewartii]|uniref:Uncharacterized protein n=1 Tax=Polyrhizophydium stewartii TaxID=2732419 RepID=A0ABR4NBI0_9FUNG
MTVALLVLFLVAPAMQFYFGLALWPVGVTLVLATTDTPPEKRPSRDLLWKIVDEESPFEAYLTAQTLQKDIDKYFISLQTLSQQVLYDSLSGRASDAQEPIIALQVEAPINAFLNFAASACLSNRTTTTLLVSSDANVLSTLLSLGASSSQLALRDRWGYGTGHTVPDSLSKSAVVFDYKPLVIDPTRLLASISLGQRPIVLLDGQDETWASAKIAAQAGPFSIAAVNVGELIKAIGSSKYSPSWPLSVGSTDQGDTPTSSTISTIGWLAASLAVPLLIGLAFGALLVQSQLLESGAAIAWILFIAGGAQTLSAGSLGVPGGHAYALGILGLPSCLFSALNLATTDPNYIVFGRKRAACIVLDTRD